MIIVPATISRIEDWLPFVQFLGQKYHARFFELPGHAGSTAFAEPYRSELVAESVGHLADHLGLESFVLMGFSFGGILTLKTLRRLGDRIDKVVLLSPCVSHHGLKHSAPKLWALKGMVEALRLPLARRGILGLMHDARTVDSLVWFMTEIGKYETNADLKALLLEFPEATLDVLLSQVREVLSVEAEDLAGPFTQSCFFGMSVNDPLLDYGVSEAFVREHFGEPIIEAFDFAYHVPPEPFDVEWLNRDYQALLDVWG